MADLLENVPELGPFGSESRGDEIKQWSGFSSLSISDQRIVAEVRRGKRPFAFILSNGDFILFKNYCINRSKLELNWSQEGYTVFKINHIEDFAAINRQTSAEKAAQTGNIHTSSNSNSVKKVVHYLYCAMSFLCFIMLAIILYEINNLPEAMLGMSMQIESVAQDQSGLAAKTQADFNLLKDDMNKIVFKFDRYKRESATKNMHDLPYNPLVKDQ